jgi:hypothetical protein
VDARLWEIPTKIDLVGGLNCGLMRPRFWVLVPNSLGDFQLIVSPVQSIYGPNVGGRCSKCLELTHGHPQKTSGDFSSVYGRSNTVEGPNFNSTQKCSDAQINGWRRSGTEILVGDASFSTLVPRGRFSEGSRPACRLS